MLHLLITMAPADVAPDPEPWEATSWTVPAVAAFLVVAVAVVVVAVVLIRRGRR